MKGLAMRKLGRTSSHRRALLRNLVTSLIAHERISTTVAKAKEAQRVAEKIITKAKRAQQGEVQQGIQARDYLFPNPLQPSYPRLLQLATRYADRPGGYTRLHLHGARAGDNAPRALLELVDGPGDVRLEMTARAMARETLLSSESSSASTSAAASASASAEAGPSKLPSLDAPFRSLTRKNISKLVRFNASASSTLLAKAHAEYWRLQASSSLLGERRPDEERQKNWGAHAPRGENVTSPMLGRRIRAGEEDGMNPANKPKMGARKSSVIRLGKGAFASRLRPRVEMPAERRREAPRAAR